MCEWEISYWLLIHSIVMLSIYSLLALSLDHIDVRPHLLYFFILLIFFLFNIFLYQLMLMIHLGLLSIDFFLFFLLFFDLSLFHAFEVLVEETSPLYGARFLLKK